MSTGQIIGLFVSLLIGGAAGVLIYRKWKWPKKWIEFGFLFVFIAAASFSQIDRGAHFLWLGDYFDLRAGAVGYGVAAVLATAFLLRKYIDWRLTRKQAV